MKDLLIVEDDPTLGEGIRLALQAPELRPQLCRSLSLIHISEPTRP